MLDNLATRYRTLPSEVLRSADTVDLYVSDIANKWALHQQGVREGTISPNAHLVPKLSQQQMLDLVNSVKEKK